MSLEASSQIRVYLVVTPSARSIQPQGLIAKFIRLLLYNLKIHKIVSLEV